jgi:hypothetical protein
VRRAEARTAYGTLAKYALSASSRLTVRLFDGLFDFVPPLAQTRVISIKDAKLPIGFIVLWEDLFDGGGVNRFALPDLADPRQVCFGPIILQRQDATRAEHVENLGNRNCHEKSLCWP